MASLGFLAPIGLQELRFRHRLNFFRNELRKLIGHPRYDFLSGFQVFGTRIRSRVKSKVAAPRFGGGIGEGGDPPGPTLGGVPEPVHQNREGSSQAHNQQKAGEHNVHARARKFTVRF